jgi:hydroxylysine kinase
VPHLEEFVHVVNEAQRGMVEDIITQFQTRVLDNIEEFPQQIIHGDFNEQNILVGKGSNGEYKVSGFIDFGDTQKSCLIFEIAISLAYMLLTTGQIETGGYFLGGYKMTRLIPPNEMKVLKVENCFHSTTINDDFCEFSQLCVCARLCQSLVLGLYTHQFDKGNEYLLTTQKAGWKLLEDLYSRSDEDVINLWNAVENEYLSQSHK